VEELDALAKKFAGAAKGDLAGILKETEAAVKKLKDGAATNGALYVTMMKKAQDKVGAGGEGGWMKVACVLPGGRGGCLCWSRLHACQRASHYCLYIPPYVIDVAAAAPFPPILLAPFPQGTAWLSKEAGRLGRFCSKEKIGNYCYC
jgi:hypothetical protein